MPYPSYVRCRTRCVALASAWVLATACGPGHPGPALRLGAGQDFDPDVVELIERLADAVDAQPKSTDPRVQLALAFEANELWARAESCWDQALSMDPDQAVWLAHRAAALTKRGALDEGMEGYERAVELDPYLVAARQRLGLLLLEQGQDELALTEFREVMQRFPQSALPYIGAAQALNNLEREEEAVKACLQALEHDTGNRRAHYVLGLAYRGLGRMAEAERELALGADSETEILPDPLSGRLASYRRGYGARVQDALAHINSGEPERAIPLLSKALEARPNDRAVLVNLGVAYINRKRYSEGIEVLHKAHALDLQDFAVLINLATAELALKRLPEALEHSEQTVRAAPNISATYYMRSHAYLVHGRVDEAYADLIEAASLDTGDPRYPIEAGDCAVRMNRMEDAIDLYAKGLRLQPNHLPALVSTAVVADQLGRRPVAVDAYQRAKALAPEHERVVRLGKRLGLE